MTKRKSPFFAEQKAKRLAHIKQLKENKVALLEKNRDELIKHLDTALSGTGITFKIHPRLVAHDRGKKVKVFRVDFSITN
tara:strand:- start:4167 stop:4406 length:240 start_codon:yes stop_codon:yes gene_type:complete